MLQGLQHQGFFSTFTAKRCSQTLESLYSAPTTRSFGELMLSEGIMRLLSLYKAMALRIKRQTPPEGGA